jgi:Tfp pilus assembly protein PilN
MIKINLLGVAAPKPRVKEKEKGETPAKTALQVGVFLAALVVSFGAVGLMYLIWSGSVTALNIELKKQKAEQTRLAAIRQENAKYDRERALLEQRIKAVQMLQTSRVGPTDFMNALGNVVSKTPTDLYFFSVTHQGDRVVIQGQAGSANSVATLMSSLKTSGHFDDVQLRQFFEDDKDNLASFKFNIDCSYKSPAEAGPLTQARAGAVGATTSQRPGL